METPVQKWYAGRNIFITGGTGFMGKVLLEKMLRCLPSIKNIYILTRPKRGMDPQERIAKIFDIPLFDRLREENPKAMSKLVAIEGDLSQRNLGISDKDRKTLEENISVVFHAGATLKLEATLKESILMNTIGTKSVMELAKNMKKLAVFVHLSTAFCHCDVKELEEIIYPPTKDPYEMIELAEKNTTEHIAKLEKELIYPFPNTYTFTKRLAETVAWDLSKKYNIPLVIGRPSIVIPTLKEPMPGWVDSLNGPIGVLIASGKGVLRSVMVKENNYGEVIPVDIAINGLITSAYCRATKMKKDEQFVVNITTSREILPITWEEVIERGKKQIWENPFEWMLWYPNGQIRNNRLIHNIIVFLFQIIPAYFVDFIFWCLRMPRFMVRVQEKIKFGLHLLEYFTLNEWRFFNKNALGLSKHLNSEDMEIFYMENAKYDIDEFLKMAILGARKYILKEDPKSLPFWRKVLTFLYVLDKVAKTLVYYGLLYFALYLVNFQYLISYSFWFDTVSTTPGHSQISK